jgi:hypothetical protein
MARAETRSRRRRGIPRHGIGMAHDLAIAQKDFADVSCGVCEPVTGEARVFRSAAVREALVGPVSPAAYRMSAGNVSRIH